MAKGTTGITRLEQVVRALGVKPIYVVREAQRDRRRPPAHSRYGSAARRVLHPL